MAMKMFNKSECEYKGGYIVKNGTVVGIDNQIVDLFNQLEEDIQRSRFESACEVQTVIPHGEFRRQTEHGKIYPHVTADTPELDKLVEHSMNIMDELDDIEVADRINEYFAGIIPLIQFINDEFIVSGDQAVQHRFDLPTIGNPLELDKDRLSDLVVGIFK